MDPAIVSFLQFVITEMPLIKALYDAMIGGSMSREEIMAGIKAAQVAAADAAVKADLGRDP